MVPDSYTEKFEFICAGDSSYRIYNPFILVFAVFGAILLAMMFCICIIILKIKGIICRGRNGQSRAQLRAEAQLVSEMNRQRALDQLEKYLPTKEYQQNQSTIAQEACCICFEEFKASSKIKETVCMHIFHAECLKEWIKTKYERPDCPSCRLAIVLEEVAPPE